ncbi:hypothetical protein ACIQCR_20165 [Streptomyces sp. NPDC093249]|uniref:hypothetical protein n=1 Tax=unclassified Streptomyces TaxID=2593676 RepID=UPI0037F82625
MTGTDRIAEAAGDADALFVLTAALLTPARFPSVLGDDYPAACAALGLAPYADGYGLLFGQDGLGARWTVVVDDVSLVAVAISSWDCGMAYDLSPDENSVVAGLPGWPLPVATRAPGVPAPHDPAPEEGDPPPLAPPRDDEWGPAQRRTGADEVARQWSVWRARVADDGTLGSPVSAGGRDATTTAPAATSPGAIVGTGDIAGPGGLGGARPDSSHTPPGARSGPRAPAATGSGPAAQGSTLSPATDPYDGVRRALDQLRGYLEDPPPAGRVRSDTGAAGGGRTLRADGPGWSLVARTDDMAFVLLDELPRAVLPVARGARLPALLSRLDAMALRPS